MNEQGTRKKRHSRKKWVLLEPWDHQFPQPTHWLQTLSANPIVCSILISSANFPWAKGHRKWKQCTLEGIRDLVSEHQLTTNWWKYQSINELRRLRVNECVWKDLMIPCIIIDKSGMHFKSLGQRNEQWIALNAIIGVLFIEWVIAKCAHFGEVCRSLHGVRRHGHSMMMRVRPRLCLIPDNRNSRLLTWL